MQTFLKNAEDRKAKSNLREYDTIIIRWKNFSEQTMKIVNNLPVNAGLSIKLVSNITPRPVDHAANASLFNLLDTRNKKIKAVQADK